MTKQSESRALSQRAVTSGPGVPNEREVSCITDTDKVIRFPFWHYAIRPVLSMLVARIANTLGFSKNRKS